LKKTYGLEIAKVLPLGFGSQQTKDSVIEGEAQLGLVGTSDGSLEELGLVILEDDKGLQVSQNLVPSCRSRRSRTTLTSRRSSTSCRVRSPPRTSPS
jgi:osmoprotectant transport system substrate-binding protein